MIECECGRKFNTPQGLGNHKNYCGKKKISIDKGYKYYIGNDGNIVYIHREVMEKKIGRKLKPEEIVHHKDEDKLNNEPSNLELSDSVKHSKHHYKRIDTKNWTHVVGENVGTSKLQENDVVEIKKLINKGKSNNFIAEKYGVHCSTISDIRTKRTWKHI